MTKAQKLKRDFKFMQLILKNTIKYEDQDISKTLKNQRVRLEKKLQEFREEWAQLHEKNY